MGSIFSGRKPSKTAKPFPEQFVTLDIRKLQKSDGLEPGEAYNLHKYKLGEKCGIFSIVVYPGCLELRYTARSHEANQLPPQVINITQTPCHFGGNRAWFLCPGDQCGRRVAILYGPNLMLCRRCWGIAYQSQRENQIQRMFRKLRLIEASYTGRPNDSAPRDRTRPVGMHHRTFKLLQEKHQRLFTEIQFAQIEELRRLDELLDKWG
ncbi:hypothetical protein SAMN04487881_2375 [Marinobacter sp. es.048]|uniref:hypothetical protein n=1 Tax=Marinobacter sp. es.048 TaxID=1761795 RepID=UPI000B5959BC|nr:hypothetical protein [Marinobacter sp. es.048]SNC74474.1 hypothetical protein SAMN04487881_2375 [Marinobacter sp. es.048]